MPVIPVTLSRGDRCIVTEALVDSGAASCIFDAQFARLVGIVAEKGMSVIPLELKAGRYIKVVLGIGRGRKTHDKRSRIKERDVERRLKRGEEV